MVHKTHIQTKLGDILEQKFIPISIKCLFINSFLLLSVDRGTYQEAKLAY